MYSYNKHLHLVAHDAPQHGNFGQHWTTDDEAVANWQKEFGSSECSIVDETTVFLTFELVVETKEELKANCFLTLLFSIPSTLNACMIALNEF